MQLKVQFYLDNYTSKKSSKICLFLTMDGKRKKMSIGESVPVNLWDKSRELCKSSYELASIVNNRIFEIRDFCFDHFNYLKKNNLYSYEKFLADITDFVKGKTKIIPSVIEKSFYELWEEFTNFKFSNGIINTGTLRIYKRARKYLHEYQPNLTFDMIDERFITEYKTYLIKSKNLTRNATSPMIKNSLLVFLNWALMNDYHKNLKYKNYKHTNTVKRHNIYLSLNELEKIYLLENLPPYLENARIWLFVNAFTGVRISDESTLNISAIDFERNEIKLIVKKTSELLILPIIPILKPFLEKFVKGDVYKVSNQKLNVHYKELGKLAGIDNPITVTTFKISREDTIVPKYTLISHHCFRRSFATNSMTLKIPIHIIMKCTGHTTEESFRRYVGYTSEDAIEIMNEKWKDVKFGSNNE